MPRKAAFTIRALEELFQQLRYVPPDTRERQMNAAERLIHEIDPERNYPESFVVYRITGYRPESVDDDATLVGAALVSNLANFVLRLSEQLSLPARGEARTVLSMNDVATRLNVAPRSIQRYRRKGLVVHSVIYPDGSRRLGCFEDALEWFLSQHRQSILRAAEFSRVDPGVEARIIGAARLLRDKRGETLNTTARILASQFDRSHETVRRILMRHDRESETPIFANRRPLSDRELRLIYRAWRRGVPVPAIADRFGRTAPTIHRLVNRARAEELATFDLQYVTLPTFAMKDAETVLLSARAVNTGLDLLLSERDALLLLDRAQAEQPLSDDDETSLIACYNFLKKRASEALADRPEWPGARLLDDVETSLRWATLIKRRITSAALPTAIRTIEQHLGRRLALQPSDSIRSHLALAVGTISDVTETIDPGRSQRLERRCRFAIARELARRRPPDSSQRAAARHETGTIMLDSLFAGLTPWSALLDLPVRLVGHVHELDEPGRTIVMRHYGLDGRSPQTCQAIAGQMNVTDTAVRRHLINALAELRRMCRTGGR